MIQQATDDLLWDARLDCDSRKGMAQRMEGPGNFVMNPGDDMA